MADTVVAINTASNPAYIKIPSSSGGAGATNFNVVSTAGPIYNAKYNDLVEANPTASAIAVNLPAASSVLPSTGNVVVVRIIGGAQHAVSVVAHAGDLLNGVASVDLTLQNYLYLVSDGISSWTVISHDVSTVTNPMMFGADPTGVNPSDAAFALAIALHTNDAGLPGGEVEIPSGTFRFIDNLVLQDSPILLRGKSGGLASTTVLSFPAGKGVIVRNQAQWSVLEYFAIHGTIPPAWTPNTLVNKGDVRVNTLFIGAFTNMVEVAQNAGVTGAVEPTWPIRAGLGYQTEGTLTVDGTVTWKSVSSPGVWVLTQCTIKNVYVQGCPGDGFYWYGYVLPPRTTLTVNLNIGDVTAHVVDTSTFPDTGTIVCGTEYMDYSGKTANTFTGLIRGVRGTTEQNHLVGDTTQLPGSVSSGSSIIACQAQLNLGRALYIEGTDSNGGGVEILLGQNNYGGGIYDNSDVGNYFDACLMESNGIGNWVAAIGVTAFQDTGTRNVVIPAKDLQTGFLYATQLLSIAPGGMVRTGGNLVTVTSVAHGFQVGDVVEVTPGEANFPAGDKIVTGAAADTFTYAEAGANVANASRQSIRSVGVTGLVEPTWPAVLGTTVHDGTAVWVTAAVFTDGQPYKNRPAGTNAAVFAGCYDESGQFIEIYNPGTFLPGPSNYENISPASTGLAILGGATNGLKYVPLSQPLDGAIFAKLGANLARSVFEWGRTPEGDHWDLVLSGDRLYWQLAYKGNPSGTWYCNDGSQEGGGNVFFPFGLFFGSHFGIARAMNQNAYSFGASGAAPDPASGNQGDVFWNVDAGVGLPDGWRCVSSAPGAEWVPFYLPGRFVTQTIGGDVIVSPRNGGSSQEIIASGNITSITVNALPATGTEIMASRVSLKLVQNAAGTATWPTTFINAKIAGGAFAKSLGANAIDTITFEWDGAFWNEVARALHLS